MLPRERLPELTDRLPLGANGLEVSPFCQGMTEDADTISAAFEAGINFFFVTADMHWPLYEATRRGLRTLLESKAGARDEIVVGVVSYVTQPEFCWAPFLEVLQELDPLQRIDVTIAGGCYGHEIGARSQIYATHREVGHAGARAIGATFHDRGAARELLDSGPFDIEFVRYNPSHPGARTEVFPHVKSRAEGRRALLYNFNSTQSWITDEDHYAAIGVGADNWRPHATDYYRFALTEPALDGLLCGLPSAGSVRDLADAVARGPLDEEDHQYLLDLAELDRQWQRAQRAG